jgi:hypothetical protein
MSHFSSRIRFTEPVDGVVVLNRGLCRPDASANGLQGFVDLAGLTGVHDLDVAFSHDRDDPGRVVLGVPPACPTLCPEVRLSKPCDAKEDGTRGEVPPNCAHLDPRLVPCSTARPAEPAGQVLFLAKEDNSSLCWAFKAC